MSGDYTKGDTIYHDFSSRAFGTGIPTVIASTPVLKCIENASATPVTTGLTLVVDIAGVAGLHSITVDTSVAAYEAGKFYTVYVSTGTVDGVTVIGESVFTFTLEAGAAFARLGAPVGASVSADILVIDDFVDGIEQAVIVNAVGADISADIATAQADLDEITDPAGDGVVLGEAGVDLILDEVNTGATHNFNNSLGKQIRQGVGDVLDDGTLRTPFAASTAVLATSASAVDGFYKHSKVVAVEGTGAGQERVIGDYTGSTRTCAVTPDWKVIPDATTKYEVRPASVHASTMNGGYENGTVYLDTDDGTAGTQDNVNGTSTRPSNNIADVRTIADSIGLHKISVPVGSSILFAQAFDNFAFIGVGTIQLGGRSIAGSGFLGSRISGESLGVPNLLQECLIVDATFAGGDFVNCGLAGVITLSGTVVYRFTNCHHARTGVPSEIDFDAAVGASEVHLHDWHGNITIKNMKAGDVLHFSCSDGHITLDSTCTAGTVNWAGTFGRTDNSTGQTHNDLGLMYQRIGAPVGADISADVAAVQTVVDAIPTTAMRGTDGVDTATMRGTNDAALASVATEARLVELDAANLPAAVDAIPTTAMRGTDSAATAAVCTETRLAELDAANLPAAVDAIPTTPMRGTDDAALALEVTAARMAELDAGTPGRMANQVDVIQTDTTVDIPALLSTLQATVDALENVSAADVNAQVVDVMTVDTHVQPTAVLPLTPTIVEMMHMVAAHYRNKHFQDSSLFTLRDDADSADIYTAAISEVGGVTTREKAT